MRHLILRRKRTSVIGCGNNRLLTLRKKIQMRTKAHLASGLFVIFIAMFCLANGATGLLDAIKRRDHKAVESLINAKADVNVTQPDGASVLAWAVFLDDLKSAEMLLTAGAKVNTTDEYGETPLTLACNNGNASLVQKLIEAGANVNVARWDGSTALMLAANSGCVQAVNYLIEIGRASCRERVCLAV